MKHIKFLAFMLAMVAGVSLLSSCSDDDDPVPDYANYYIECTNVTGGSLTSQVCSVKQNSVNETLLQYYLENCSKSEAIAFFDRLMDGLAQELSQSNKTDEPLIYTFVLKNTQGGSIKSSKIIVTKQGSSVR